MARGYPGATVVPLSGEGVFPGDPLAPLCGQQPPGRRPISWWYEDKCLLIKGQMFVGMRTSVYWYEENICGYQDTCLLV